MKKTEELEHAGIAAGLHMMQPTTSRADEIIACLEGEIAKRDARIVELESDLAGTQSRVLSLQDQWRKLDAELAEIKAQEPVAWMLKNEKGRIEEILPYMPCASDMQPYWPEPLQLYAAPVAKQVVMPERWNVPRPMWKDARQPYGNPLNHADIEAAEKFNLALDEVARLNSAPVQQVSVPDGADQFDTPAEFLAHQLLIKRSELLGRPLTWREAVELTALTTSMPDAEKEKLLALDDPAPAAPAADAGHVFYGMDGNHP